MPRRAPTVEQKQKAQERRERFAGLAKQVAALSEDERAALVARCGAIVTCEGRGLSVFNSCLLISQRPGVSMVGGFRQWLAAGRCVRKGERGLSLWIPVKGKATADVGLAGELAAVAEQGDKSARPRFLVGTVFDVSQTDETAGRPVGGALDDTETE